MSDKKQKMIIKDEFLSRLRKIFDLNLYEAKVWTALLSRGVSTAGELSNIGDVPRSRTYDILESLEKKGFVIMKVGKPIKFIALKPEEVIERVKRNMMVEATEKSKRLDELKEDEVLRELSLLFTQGIKFVEPHELSGVIKGRTNLNNHLDMMVRNAQKSITLATSEDGFLRKIEALRISLEKAKKRGVKIRIAAPITKKNFKIAKDIGRIADIRALSGIKARFGIIDGKELVFMIMDDAEVHPNYDIGVWTNAPYFANAFEQLFDNAWNGMQPLSKFKL